jgi:tetratricopeptide (TPR) repeat protein
LVSLLLLGALGVSAGGCDDLSPPVTKAKPMVKTEVPTPKVPEAVIPTPPTPSTPPSEVAKTDVTPPKKETEEALPSDPLELARKLLASGDFEGALKQAKLAVGKQPQKSGAWNTLGRAELQVGHRKLALEAFEKAVELNPNNSYAHNNFGLALIYDQRPAEAIDELEQAVELEPVESYMWNNLGMAYEQLDRLDDARNAYGKAVEMQSDHAKDSLARLKGVQSVVRTAKVDDGDGNGKSDSNERKN